MSIANEKYQKIGNHTTYELWHHIPNQCPRCHTKIEPVFIESKFCEDTDSMFIFYFCKSCNKPFIAQYDEIRNHQSKGAPSNYRLAPISYIPKKFEEKIEKKFPNFCKIYNQALEAETLELDEIADMGYRKSVEFLIKDYCILLNPDKEENIKKMLLGQVIETYVTAPKIKKTAKVSAWIGNNETHYAKKFINKDIQDLKTFIEATVSFINYDLIYEDAVEIIAKNTPQGKSTSD